MSRKKSENEERIRESKEPKNRMFVEFEDGIKKLIDKYLITKKSLSKQAEDELERLIDKIVMKYYG